MAYINRFNGSKVGEESQKYVGDFIHKVGLQYEQIPSSKQKKDRPRTPDCYILRNDSVLAVGEVKCSRFIKPENFELKRIRKFESITDKIEEAGEQLLSYKNANHLPKIIFLVGDCLDFDEYEVECGLFGTIDTCIKLAKEKPLVSQVHNSKMKKERRQKVFQILAKISAIVCFFPPELKDGYELGLYVNVANKLKCPPEICRNEFVRYTKGYNISEGKLYPKFHKTA